MNKRPLNIKTRIKFEPNRFSSDCLVNVYEQLKPVESRVISRKHQENKDTKPIALTKGEMK
jgi:hypothetical protein